MLGGLNASLKSTETWDELSAPVPAIQIKVMSKYLSAPVATSPHHCL